MSGAFYFRDIQGSEIPSAAYLLRALQDGLCRLVSRTRIDFHFFSNRNRDAIILSDCWGLEKRLEALQSLISGPQSQKTLRLRPLKDPTLFCCLYLIIQSLHRCIGCFLEGMFILHKAQTHRGKNCLTWFFSLRGVQETECVRWTVHYLCCAINLQALKI